MSSNCLLPARNRLIGGKRARASSWPSSPAGNTRRASDLYRQIRKESKILVHFVFYYFSLHYIFGLFCPQRYIKSCDRFHLFMAVHMHPRIIATLWIYGLFRKDNWLYYLRQRGFSLGAFSSTLVNKQTTKQTRYAHLRGKIFKRATAINSSYALHFLK